MANIRLPKAVCLVVAEVLQPGSHAIGESLFLTAGAPGPPPNLPHTAKWKDWLFRAGNDPNVDSLSVLGNVLEEFMDVSPKQDSQDFAEWRANRDRVVQVLEEYGFRYYRGGRVLPMGQTPDIQPLPVISDQRGPTKPEKIDDLYIYSVSRLNRLRSALGRLLHFAFEALVMLLSAEMPVDAMADLIDEHDTRVWRVLMHYVEQAHAKSDWSAVRRIAVDEPVPGADAAT